ncbi:MAG: STN and carboxypeptidase regulatory-like domain-containing protein [Chitinophagaceae bacterium]
MKHPGLAHLRVFTTVLIVCLFSGSSYSQAILNMILPPLEVNNQRLDNVLEIISNKGNFYFSYNSNIIKKDSIVSLSLNNKTVKQVLDYLFRGSVEYKESGNYIILRLAAMSLTLITNQSVSDEKTYLVTGFVLDEKTGEKISNASIYEKQRLVSSLTNSSGFFSMRLKNRSGKASLTVSKELYQDTTVDIQPKLNQQLTITILPVEFTGRMITVSPTDYLLPDSIAIDVEIDSTITRYVYIKSDSFKVEKTGIGNFLLSSRLKVQSVNLKKFFINKPFQFSIVPGLSTHGRMSAQVVNNLSISLLGGYSSGVNGLELGGLFNIDKKNVQYVQVAGLFNIVGGYMKGVQVAGLSNTVLNNVEGIQAAGINNLSKGSVKGLQLGGIYNHSSGKITGLQIAGISNFSKDMITGTQVSGVANVGNKQINGLQIAGVANYSKEVKGVQISSVLNYTKRLHGVQIGLINISDSSDGLSIGLINIVLKGYHKLSFSTNEAVNANVAFKTGTSKLYSILQAGANIDSSKKIYSFGYGLGKEISLGKRFAINPELTSQYLYLGSWDYLNLLNKINVNLTVKFGRYFSIFGGPSFAVYYSNQAGAETGYKFPVASVGHRTYDMGKNVIGWIGWNAGINIF